MQGVDAPSRIAAAIGTAAGAGVDVVVLARGGGSRTDLVAFDHELVARAVAACERPVFTGIGHETDRSVADETAHTACSTPTAAARAVVSRVEQWLERLDDTGRAIAVRGRRALGRSRSPQRPDRGRRGPGRPNPQPGGPSSTSTPLPGGSSAPDGPLPPAPGTGPVPPPRRLAHAGPAVDRKVNRRLDRASARVSVAGRHEIRHAQHQLDSVAARVRTLDPAVILRRGLVPHPARRRDAGALGSGRVGRRRHRHPSGRRHA